MNHTSEVARLTRRRTEEIFGGLQRRIFTHTDHLFAVLMGAQWLFGVAAAYWISPRTWAGSTSQIHIHMWAATMLGGLISAFPIALAILRPGRASTRYTIAVGQMLTSALLIHLTGGRIETHFHVFGSLAFLAFYRDWRVLVPATVVIAADHFLRGLFWPQSVYGVLSASHWRFLEHAGWVVFEDVVLAASCLRGTRELWHIAERTAEFETSEARYRAIVGQTGEGIFVFDVATRSIIEYNPAFMKLAGATADEIAALHVGDALLPAGESLDVTVAALVRDRTPVVSERGLRRPDGTFIDVACSLSPTSYAGSEAVCVVVRDISDHRRIEAELACARDAALQSARLKSEFLANMSHEIRTPMNGVVGMTGLLLETDLTPQQRDFGETIQASADSLLAIINDILDFSKVDAGKLHFEVLDFDLHQAIDGTLDLPGARACSKGLELAAYVDYNVPTQLVGDPGRLRQVLTNLVGNAVKFTERGEITVRAALDSDVAGEAVVRFEVRDTGIGIPAAEQPRLFDAFTQADGSTTRKYGGTGLGLAICKRLVELMGGEIGVRSVVGEGSTFWFTARFQKQSEAALDGPVPIPALEGRRVLIVDDNETNRRILHHQLDGWGIEHHGVSNGEDALAELREAARRGYAFELAILDRQMPGMDGVTLLHAIKRDPAIAPVRLIMMTSFGDIGDTDELLASGLAECMTKPVKHLQLRECLERVLKQTPDAPQRSRRSELAAPPRSTRARVLVAEDNIINQKVTLAQLRRLGYMADAVANGAEAVEALSRIPYDIVLMDCQMPDVDGYEATRMIRRQPGNVRTIPIIAMTANALAGDREKCLAAGMDDYVTKPVKAADLHEALTQWTAKPRLDSPDETAEPEPIVA